MNSENSTQSKPVPLDCALAGKPTVEQFVIAQANITLQLLIQYEAQYTRTPPQEIRERIIGMADFIKDRLAEYAS